MNTKRLLSGQFVPPVTQQDQECALRILTIVKERFRPSQPDCGIDDEDELTDAIAGEIATSHQLTEVERIGEKAIRLVCITTFCISSAAIIAAIAIRIAG